MIKLMSEVWNENADPANLWVNRCLFVIGPCIGCAGLVALAIWWAVS